MSYAIDESIKEIAVKHGVSISRDDPILILQTMHQQLLEKQLQAQQEMLDKFKSEIELISSRWQYDAKDKAEKTLNSALDASKKMIDSSFKASINEAISEINTNIVCIRDKSFAELSHTKKQSQYMLIVSGAMFFASMLYCIFFFFL